MTTVILTASMFCHFAGKVRPQVQMQDLSCRKYRLMISAMELLRSTIADIALTSRSDDPDWKLS